MFALLFEKGLLGSSLSEISLEQRSKITRHLALRIATTNELLSFLDKSLFEMKKIALSYDNASHDLLLNLQYITKKLLVGLAHSRIHNYLETIMLRTQYLSFQIKFYLTQDLFANKSFTLTNASLENNQNNRKKRLLIHS